jgi:hypothetical protein
LDRGLDIGVISDALECDIHVSKDNVAMVIHGDKLTTYAYFIGPGSDERRFKEDEDKTCGRYTCEQIQSSFALKTFEKVYPKDPKWNEVGMPRAIAYYNSQLSKEPELHQIPTLRQVLELVADENSRREQTAKPFLKLNIELKGEDSSFITLATLAKFNSDRLKNQLKPITAEEIILLGNMQVGEARIANGLLKHGKNFLDNVAIPDSKSITPELYAELNKLFGEEEAEYYYKVEAEDGWELYYYNNKAECAYVDKKGNIVAQQDLNKETREIRVLPDLKELFNRNIPAKAIIIDSQGLAFYILKGQIFEGNMLETSGVFIGEDLLKTIHNEYTRIGLGQIRPASVDLKPNPNSLFRIDINYFKLKRLIEMVIRSTGGVPAKYREIPKNSGIGNIKQRVTAYQKSVDSSSKSINLHVLKDYLRSLRLEEFTNIRTTLMLSTGELYGRDAVIGDDFDLRHHVWKISDTGRNFVRKCMQHGYDGIDVSLFDFDESLISEVSDMCSALRNKGLRTVAPIIGVTASNWKGVAREMSPVTPQAALMQARRIAERLRVDILMKVDEPGTFKLLYKFINSLEPSKRDSEEIIAMEFKSASPNNIGSKSFLEGIQVERLSPQLSELHDSVLSPSPKPPRGLFKSFCESIGPLESTSYPDQNSSLFNTIIFAYLLPSIENDMVFKQKFICLFGDNLPKINTNIQKLRAELSLFDIMPDYFTSSVSSSFLNKLIQENFITQLNVHMNFNPRTRLNSIIAKNKDTDFFSNQYLSNLSFLDRFELTTLSQMISTRVTIHQQNATKIVPIIGADFGVEYDESINIIACGNGEYKSHNKHTARTKYRSSLI